MIDERKIILYNELTKLDNTENEINFLESIDYKLKYGNILLDNLIELEKHDIHFEILEGYIDKSFYTIPLFNTFEVCTIKFLDKIDLEILNPLLKNVKIERHETKTDIIYLFVDKGDYQ